MKTVDVSKSFILFTLVMGMWVAPGLSFGHCDTMDGPVVMTAKAALEKGDVTPILKWVKKDDEKKIRDLFQKTLVERNKGKEAKETADVHFFEALVRIHQTGEGTPYTGLKSGPAEAIIVEADKAVEWGWVGQLANHVSEAVIAGIRERFNRVKETKRHADESVEKGREFVAAYVEFTHYVERLHQDAVAAGAHHAEVKDDQAGGHHH